MSNSVDQNALPGEFDEPLYNLDFLFPSAGRDLGILPIESHQQEINLALSAVTRANDGHYAQNVSGQAGSSNQGTTAQTGRHSHSETLCPAPSQAASAVTAQEPQSQKNRLAQKRYRERKKVQFNSQQEQIKGMSEELQRMSVALAEADRRTQELERALALRDSMPHRLQPKGSGTPESEESIPEPLHPDFLKAYAVFHSLLYPAKDVRSGVESQPSCNPGPSDIVRMAEDYRTRLVKLMLHINEGTREGIHQDIVKLVEARRQQMTVMVKHMPDFLAQVGHVIRRRGIESGRFILEPALQRLVLDVCATMQEKMDLTLAQKVKMLEVRQRINADFEQITKRSREICLIFEAAGTKELTDMSASSTFVKASEAINEMRDRYFRREHAGGFMRQLISQVVQPLQEAHAEVEAWPNRPDAIMIADLIKQELEGYQTGQI